MPTKPIVQPAAWATDAVYTTGPFVGQPQKVVPPGAFAAEGHRPGALFPTPAEYENSQQNRITALCRWLFLGTSAPDPDAHVVETNASGYAGLFGLTVTNNVDGPSALALTSVNTLIPAASFTCLTGASALQANAGASGGSALDANIGAGSGVALLATTTGTLAGGAAVRAFCNNTTAAPGVDVVHLGSGAGVVITHSGTGYGLDVLGNSTLPAIRTRGAGNQPAIVALGSGNAPGVSAQSSATAGADGVLSVLANNSGAALHGLTSGGAGSSASAVFAEAINLGIGLRAVAASGPAISASATNASGVALFMPGKAGDPSNLFDGRMDFNTTTRTFVISDAVDGAYRDLWSSRGGVVLGAATGGFLPTTAGAVNWQTAATLTLTGSNAPKRALRTLVLRISFTPRAISGIADTISFRLRDTTAGSDVLVRSGIGTGATAGIYLPGAVNVWQSNTCIEVQYTIPVAGDRTFTLDFRSTGASEFQVRDASIVPFGLF